MIIKKQQNWQLRQKEPSLETYRLLKLSKRGNSFTEHLRKKSQSTKLYSENTTGGSIHKSFYEDSITLIMKLEKDRIKKLQINFHYRCRYKKSVETELNLVYFGGNFGMFVYIIHHYQVGIISGMQGWLNIWKIKYNTQNPSFTVLLKNFYEEVIYYV